MKIYEHDEPQKWQRPVQAKPEEPFPRKPELPSGADSSNTELLAFYIVQEDFHDRISKIQERLSRVLALTQETSQVPGPVLDPERPPPPDLS